MKNLVRGFLPPRVVTAVLFLLVLVSPVVGAQEKISLVGSGSNVPSSLYGAWAEQFNSKNSAVQMRYLSMSTIDGIANVSKGTGDFAAGEIPLSEEQMHGSKVTLIQIPSVVVGLVPIYNLAGQPQLRFSGKLLSQIFLGTIKNWRDPAIAKLNPGVSLPDLPIKVVHRTGGKGSNYIFSEYLSKSDAEWKSKIGTSPSPAWPLGEDANRGEDMVAKVAATLGAIGYVELNFARHSELGYAEVENPAGKFVRAAPASLTASCAAMEKSIKDDFRVSLTSGPGKESYPIASFTWLYVPVSGLAPERSKALKQFLEWALGDGQELAKTMGYATLPTGLVEKARAKVKSVP
jgi:phosphate transport system substrate-binding protein